MAFKTYGVVKVKTVEEIGKEINHLNYLEFQKESDLVAKGTDSKIFPRRWKPCGPISFAEGYYILPIVRNEMQRK